MTKTKFCIGAILATIALSGCNGDSNTTDKDPSSNNVAQTNRDSHNQLTSINPHTSQLHANRGLKEDQFLLKMGAGYDRFTKTAVSNEPCLVGASNQDNIYIGNPRASIDFDEAVDVSRLENALNVSVSGSYGGDRFNVSAAAEFANSSKDDAYTINLVYLYNYSGKATFKAGALGQGFNALTPYAEDLEKNHPTKFR